MEKTARPAGGDALRSQALFRSCSIVDVEALAFIPLLPDQFSRITRFPAAGEDRVQSPASQKSNNVKEPKAVRNFLESRLGKELDLNCGSLSVSGKLVKVEGNVAHIEKDEVICYINIEKIIAVWDTQDKKLKAPGFISNSTNLK